VGLMGLGDWVLVHAGAGGVGLAACQVAKGKMIYHALGILC
jgi:NADPH:quinone reductase-like Zn-dependent oxidoreductase